MCGIVGAFAFGKPDDIDPEQEKIRQELMIFMTTELLQQTQSRGEDATGIATLFDNGMYMGLKSGINAVSFISSLGGKETDYQGYLKIWRNKVKHKNQRYARIHIGHCRKSSVGNSTDNNNNHPIVVDPIIGIHNGTLKNHDIIFEKLDCERTGDVDSEAIMRLTHFYTNGGKHPFTAKMMKEVATRLDGTFATIIMNANNPYQVALMKDMRPIEMRLIRPLKLVLVASESKFFDIMLFRYRKYVTLYQMGGQFPLLKQSDVEEKSLTNDDVIVFDLTREITKDTKFIDLYDSDRVVYSQKKWKATYTARTSYYSSGNRNAYSRGNKDVKTSTNTKTAGTKSKTATGTGADTPAGKVWNKSLQSFKTATGGTMKNADAGNVVVNVKTGNVSKLSKVKNAEAKLVTPTADVHISKPKDDDKQDNKAKATSTNTVVNAVVVNEVDMTVNTEALEVAEKHAKLTKLYENEDEVVNDLDVLDRTVLKNLPIVALANRFKKFIYKVGFYDGYCYREEMIEEKRPDLKARKREQNIRVLKAMTKTLGDVVDGLCSEKVVRNFLREIEKPKELTPDKVDKIMRVGDVRDNRALKAVVNWVKEDDKK